MSLSAKRVDIELLTTSGCHLCEQAEALVRQALPGVEIIKVDIAERDALIEQYGTLIPVLRYQGRELCWPFGLLDIRERLLV
ncbi:glutaredoxin family protein [Alcanivorax sp. JB21]|uniref:glutaredoxin family protein n=1 Tax=Alcanivorax limicola TaxID=2874102 RepID=UPI001CBCC5C0|nr:glutaredoxin family protein [Alcanivorax limicola]MBZ2188065.1 glutaredoxin family protein [Alcanivorax limicola]